MRLCILQHPGCEQQTAGSVGAAGVAWPMICQNCKDIEDRDAYGSLVGMSDAIDSMVEVPPPAVEVAP